MRIVVAMSGGVDSSVAAALLVDEGHDVIGLSMQLYDQRGGETFGSCCTLDDLHDARRVAGQLGIPHYIVNLERRFDDRVVSNFVSEYLAGRTPIPCTHCNTDLKFASLVDRALGFEAACVATGHYVRVHFDESRGRHILRRGTDASKDQSYFLFGLTQDQLARACFPIGHLEKPAVRATAARLGLGVARKPDSQELCFVPPGDHAAFVGARAGDRALDGDITDAAGDVLGHHDGIHRFTVGQRKGLRLAAGVPLYVVAIDADRNRVIVGERHELERRAVDVTGMNWIACEAPPVPMVVRAQIRHRHQAAPATIVATGDDGATVVFDEPQAAVTPGQALVCYDGDVVVGGGWIARAR